ncbi:MAG: GNAT family N-acetyltransferase [Alphaproteobacteria bacterium]|nr:GNAT family N-acetyltransferase [Alphaproteobacteria bacterium]
MVDEFLAELMKHGATSFVSNAPVQVLALEVAGFRMPVTISAPSACLPLSWVVSLRSAYGPYAAEEMHTLPVPALRPALKAMVRWLDEWLVAAQLDKLVCINNWLLSTNLYPAWNGEGLGALLGQLTQDYPDHFIAFRSLNYRHHAALLRSFKQAGWHLLPSRQVWLASPQARGGLMTRDRKNDARLLKKTALKRARADTFSDADWERAAKLYEMLYLEKYSRLNPIFTPAFLRWASHSSFMRIEGLREAQGNLLGVVGTIASDTVMTTPLVGYDTSAPPKLGLYRLLTAIAFEDMERRGLCFNLSAGVGGFKKNRGARAEIEYTALWCRHLSARRQRPIKALEFLLNRIGRPLMERYEL